MGNKNAQETQSTKRSVVFEEDQSEDSNSSKGSKEYKKQSRGPTSREARVAQSKKHSNDSENENPKEATMHGEIQTRKEDRKAMKTITQETIAPRETDNFHSKGSSLSRKIDEFIRLRKMNFATIEKPDAVFHTGETNYKENVNLTSGQAKDTYNATTIVLDSEDKTSISYCEVSQEIHLSDEISFQSSSLLKRQIEKGEFVENPDAVENPCRITENIFIENAAEIIGHMKLNNGLYFKLAWKEDLTHKDISERCFSFSQVQANNPKLISNYLRTYVKYN